MIINKLRTLIVSLLNGCIVAVEDSSYSGKERLAARMGCEAGEVVKSITLAQVIEEQEIKEEVNRLQKQFNEGLKRKPRKEK